MRPDYPRLETPRLILRGFVSADGPRVQQLAGDRAIAATTMNIPHPYPDGAAEEWIATHRETFDSGKGANFAVTLRSTGELIGGCGLVIREIHKRAELGYYIGKQYWGNGYATEAAKAVIQYAFSRGIHRVFAEHYHTNPASGRVLQKAGMKHEGTLRQHMIKWDQPMDCEVYGILAND
jgi:RimJ/RimL family protein N-acetyltransferase